MIPPRYPSLYQINTRVWLNELGQCLGRAATLDDVTDEMLDGLEKLGFDWVWLLGVWQTGPAGQAVSRSQPAWRRGFQQLLPDLREDDIAGSPFAIRAYTVHADFGGDAALARLRERLRRRGIALLLDFVPNHTALDHPWASEHPEYYIAGSDDDLAREPHNYCRIETHLGSRILAHGRDPYFPGWPDTLQLNYRCAALRQAMTADLRRIAERCDGARCDMTMLLLPAVIERTWGGRSQPSDGTPAVDVLFWPDAIARVLARQPRFCFLAEVYWGLEGELQQQGFDFTYDKILYDRLRAQDAEAVHSHFRGEPEFQRKSARFLENHDEPRAASAFAPPVHRAAAVLTFLVPGMRFFHDGQLEGRKQQPSNHLGKRPAEPVDGPLQVFYQHLLEMLKDPLVRNGKWHLQICQPAWENNVTSSKFIAFVWELAGQHVLVAVNFGPTQGQCYVRLDGLDLRGNSVLLRDRMSDAQYTRAGTNLMEHGLYLDMAPWQFHVFDVVYP